MAVNVRSAIFGIRIRILEESTAFIIRVETFTVYSTKIEAANCSAMMVAFCRHVPVECSIKRQISPLPSNLYGTLADTCITLT